VPPLRQYQQLSEHLGIDRREIDCPKDSPQGEAKPNQKTLAKIRKAHPGTVLNICYEAGPTGFVIARRLAQLKVDCMGATALLRMAEVSAGGQGARLCPEDQPQQYESQYAFTNLQSSVCFTHRCA